MTEEQIKFISACVIQALVYLRKEKIIHRDIMMKNIIMDQDKYFNIIDFSSSIFYNDKNDSKKNMITYDMVTPPEILNNLNYDYNSDYYRLGCVLYYIIFKKHPLIVKRENNITDIIIDDKYTKNYTFYCIDFLNKLIISDYKKRIGLKSINELKVHPWFKGFNWKNFEKKKIKSPFNFDNIKSDSLICSNFYFSLKKKKSYINISSSLYYKSLIKNFDYINKRIFPRYYKI